MPQQSGRVLRSDSSLALGIADKNKQLANSITDKMFTSTNVDENIKQRAGKIVAALLNITITDVYLFSKVSLFTDNSKKNILRIAGQITVALAISSLAAFKIIQVLHGESATEAERRDRTVAGLAVFAVAMLITTNIIFRAARPLWFRFTSPKDAINNVSKLSESPELSKWSKKIYGKIQDFELEYHQHCVSCDFSQLGSKKDKKLARELMLLADIAQMQNSEHTTLEKTFINNIAWLLDEWQKIEVQINASGVSSTKIKKLKKTQRGLEEKIKRNWLLLKSRLRHSGDLITEPLFRFNTVLMNFLEEGKTFHIGAKIIRNKEVKSKKTQQHASKTSNTPAALSSAAPEDAADIASNTTEPDEHSNSKRKRFIAHPVLLSKLILPTNCKLPTTLILNAVFKRALRQNGHDMLTNYKQLFERFKKTAELANPELLKEEYDAGQWIIYIALAIMRQACARANGAEQVSTSGSEEEDSDCSDDEVAVAGSALPTSANVSIGPLSGGLNRRTADEHSSYPASSIIFRCAADRVSIDYDPASTPPTITFPQGEIKSGEIAVRLATELARLNQHQNPGCGAPKINVAATEDEKVAITIRPGSPTGEEY
jgi:hypothetical protein